MSLIYKPGGAALEYARWAANLRVGMEEAWEKPKRTYYLKHDLLEAAK